MAKEELKIYDTTFESNTVGGVGGAIYIRDASVVLDGCLALKNTVTSEGHFLATHNGDLANLELTNVAMSEPADGMGGKHLINLGTGSTDTATYTASTFVTHSGEFTTKTVHFRTWSTITAYPDSDTYYTNSWSTYIPSTYKAAAYDSAYTSIVLVNCTMEGAGAKSGTIKAGTGAVAIYRNNDLTTDPADRHKNVTCDATASFRWVHAARLLVCQ
jgi:predicted outer membrane repeat protein